MMALRILQGNMNTSRSAFELLSQIASERSVDVAMMCEQNRNMDTNAWRSNVRDTAAVWAREDCVTRVSGHGRGDDFVWIRLGGITLFSVYLTPNCPAMEFESKVSRIEDALRQLPGELVVAGDFNARAIEWGMPETNRRGKLLLEMAARLDLVVANRGNTTTYRRDGVGESIPDVTFVSPSVLSRMVSWQVLEDYNSSDHQYILFEIGVQGGTNTQMRNTVKRWNIKKIDMERFGEALQEMREISGTPTDREGIERLVEETTEAVNEVCRRSMPMSGGRNRHAPVYWWNEEIARLRRECNRLRRRAQRARGHVDWEQLNAEYKAAKKRLNKAIKESKRRCWRELCEEVDRDPWGEGYRIAIRRLGARSPPVTRDAEMMERIVEGLFPQHPIREAEEEESDMDIPLFTTRELLEAVKRLKPRKAPGPDGIPGEIIRMITKERPEVLLRLYNLCLKGGVFSRQWKVARLVLLDKGRGDPESPSSYRPLCLLNMMGKVMELMIRPRLIAAITAAGGLSSSQHGFRKGRSTIGAVGEVQAAFLRLQEYGYRKRPFVLVVLLDVKNAFNSARWVDMLRVFKETFNVPPYLLRIIGNYLKDRSITYTADGRQVTVDITAGIGQGTVLGGDFWNGLYDGLLRIRMPENAESIAYADDAAVVITARTQEAAQDTLNQVMRDVSIWMNNHGLQLALAKTEVIVLTRQRIDTRFMVNIGTETVSCKGEVKYLGVSLDTKMTFWPHILRVTEKAEKRMTALSMIMANTFGPGQMKKRLLMSTVNSILLYGAEIWADALKVKKYRKRMIAVQARGAHRIASAYRTVSYEAVLVIAGVIPIDLLANERKRIYERSREVGREKAAAEARVSTMQEWQTRWNEASVSRWTKTLIRNLQAWIDREFGEVNFYTTQFLTGHGYFREYLYRMGKVRDANCKYCGNERDDVRHTFFECDKWRDRRRMVENRIGQGITPENVVSIMMKDSDTWMEFSVFIEGVLRNKLVDGCLKE